MDLNKYTRTQKADIVHSSGYAREGQGDNIGSTRAQSFAARLELMKRNRKVGEYRQSGIGSRFGAQRTKTADASQTSIGSLGNTDAPSRQAFNAGDSSASSTPSTGRTFVEPPKRPYNPYG